MWYTGGGTYTPNTPHQTKENHMTKDAKNDFIRSIVEKPHSNAMGISYIEDALIEVLPIIVRTQE